MKNIFNKIKFVFIFSYFIFFSFLIPYKLHAKKVEPQNVQKVAINVFSKVTGKAKTQLNISKIIPVSVNGEVVYTIFNFEPQGHIVISNEDASEPVLGYGLDSHIDFMKIPPGLKFLLNEYKEEIYAVKKQNLRANESVQKKWDSYLKDESDLELKSYTIGSYLLETNWGQEGVYNDSCPNDPVTNNQCVVGCVGVALGQVLNYWGCRVFPDDSVVYTPARFSYPLEVKFYNQQYDWDDIETIPAATAQFLYHCAVSVKSNFGDHNIETGSTINMARSALTSIFGFNANLPVNKSSYTGTEWDNLLKNEIDSERPVIYGGMECDTCSVGHVWVVDGYNSLGKYHCNWGWNGNYQQEFYSLTDLSPDSENFTSNQKAVTNIYPLLDACSGLDGSSNICTSNESYSVTIPTIASVVWSKSSNLDQVGGNTGTTYIVNEGSSGSGYVTATIKNSHDITFLTRTKTVWAGAPGPITLYDDPTYFACGEMNIVNVDFGAFTYYDMGINQVNWSYQGATLSNINDGFTKAYITAGGSPGTGYIYVDAYNDCGSSGNRVYYEIDCFMLLISPNPTTGETTLSIESTFAEKTFDDNTEWDLEIYSPGQVLTEKKTKLKGNSTKIQTQGWQEGVYVVRVKYKDEVLTDKLVVKK